MWCGECYNPLNSQVPTIDVDNICVVQLEKTDSSHELVLCQDPANHWKVNETGLTSSIGYLINIQKTHNGFKLAFSVQTGFGQHHFSLSTTQVMTFLERM